MTICSDCAKNAHLRRRIEKTGWAEDCSICGNEKPFVFDIDELASVLAKVIKQNFGTGAHRFVLSDDDRDYKEPYGDPLETVVSEVLEQDVDFFDELLEAIVKNDDFRPQDGEECFFESGALYVPVNRSESVDYFAAQWSAIVGELKHKRRFFSESVGNFFQGLFKDVEDVKTWGTDVASVLSVVQDMPKGTTVFRSRFIDLEDAKKVFDHPFREVGPPPRSKARAGRMSPEGVVALYCAMDERTAIAELRPAIGGMAAVVALAFTRTVRLLDFERLERSLDEGWGAFLDTDFDTAWRTRNFLRKLHSLISQPVVPGHEADYLITQTMAEYLAHVHQPQFDGIIFKSVQRAGGMNVVLFSDRGWDLNDAEDTFPIEYAPGSLNFYQTRSVDYKHDPFFAVTSGKGEVSLYSESEMQDARDAWREQRA
jgi:hypothetical protein